MISKETINEIQKCILFMPTNGFGLGHLTRTLAIARRLKQQDPSVKIIFITTSHAIHLVYKEGFIGYFFPSEKLSTLKRRVWNQMFSSTVINVIRAYNPKVLVFDGVYPYDIISEIDKLLISINEANEIANLLFKFVHENGGDS
ncbi:hypothetical protein ACFSCX_02730 [Bacillus salitolerans]|uniref:Glycosyl transferase family 28 C-terminal domain-containing protein n=1 Tax=Bacillus salitolerans TaxID=1437434 RepID=A0ABW4LK06_9BACI